MTMTGQRAWNSHGNDSVVSPRPTCAIFRMSSGCRSKRARMARSPTSMRSSAVTSTAMPSHGLPRVIGSITRRLRRPRSPGRRRSCRRGTAASTAPAAARSRPGRYSGRTRDQHVPVGEPAAGRAAIGELREQRRGSSPPTCTRRCRSGCSGRCARRCPVEERLDRRTVPLEPVEVRADRLEVLRPQGVRQGGGVPAGQDPLRDTGSPRVELGKRVMDAAERCGRRRCPRRSGRSSGRGPVGP